MTRLPRPGTNRAAAIAGGTALVGAVVAVLVPFRDDLDQAAPALVLVLPVVFAAVVGGTVAAIVVGAIATVAFNLAFIPPFGNPTIDLASDAVALAVFVAVAVAVGALVSLETARRRVAEQRAVDLERLTEELRAMSAERERLAGEAARVEALERLDEQRAALLRSVSHDLRTPLATIKAVTSDLRAGTRYDDETRSELLQSVEDEAERLDRLVANLLSMSRIEAGALRPERQAVALDELIADRLKRLRRLFLQVRVEVDAPADLPYVDGDYTLVDQLLTNLLENAARHAPPRSTLRVTAAARDGTVEVRVSDEGPGVPPHEAERIFEPFRRGEGSRSSGIGLATCRAIAEAHGGSIRIGATPGGGATFVVTLPAVRSR